eukprot:TRINITY_DN24027_c0_g1_i1.p1 TRINITY_DN24027_c0_g1~~TRINITY_DN24027_c0_g1_i1.p1  ORF type:complete len:414 (-),score=87.22 TRINITY_DN24027_c0_g1_i1:61-1221(-)
MGKNEREEKRRKKAAAETGERSWLLRHPIQSALAAVLGALAVGLGLFRNAAHEESGALHDANQSHGAADEGLGPKVMTSQGPLLKKLIALLNEVEALPNENRREERMAVSKRVEAELDELEEMVDTSTAGGRQHMALINLARSALQDDRRGDNASTGNWSDEQLLKDHGLVTYASKSYWDEAYAGGRYGEAFDWFGGWEDLDLSNRSLASVLRPLLREDHRILMLGSGISNMSALMYGEGFRHIVNVDVAEPAVKQMQRIWGHLEGMEWIAMDASALNFTNGSFDVVLEKGLFDALFAGTGARLGSVLSEARRVLRQGGKLLSVSFGEDRIQRLFMPTSPSTEEDTGLSCAAPNELRFESRKSDDNRSQENRSQGKPVFVYSCDKL